MKRTILSILLALTLLLTMAIPAVAAETKPAYRTGYYYENLTTEGKEAYRALCEAITEPEMEFPDRIVVADAITDSELEDVAQAVCWDNPEFFMINYYNTYLAEPFGKGRTIVPSWTSTKEEYLKDLQTMRTAAASYLKGAPKKGSDYEKELYIHDAIIRDASYPDTDTQYTDSSSIEGDYYYQTAFSIFKDHMGVCEAYSLAASYLLTELGVKCYPVAGIGSSDGGQINAGNHAWNVVYLNGQPYVTDFLWNEVSSDDKSIYSKDAVHIFFNLPISQSGLTHWNEHYVDTYRANTSTQSYYQRTGSYYSSWKDARAALPKLTASSWKHGRHVVEFQFTNDAAYKQALKELFDKEKMGVVIQEANRQISGKKISAGNYSYGKTDWNRVIVVKLVEE